MAWALGTGALAEAASKSSSTTLTTGTGAAATAVGDVILVAVAGITQSTSITQVTDTAGNTYTALADLDLGISRFALYGTVVTTATTTSTTWTATWAAAVSTRVMCASSFTGGTITPRASTLASVEGTANTNMSVGPTGASATSGDLVWAQFVSTNATDTWTFTPTGAWSFANDATTGSSGTNRSIGTEYQVAPSTATYTGTATQSGSRAYDGIIIALQPAAASTPKDFGDDAAAASDSFTMGATLAFTETATSSDATSGPTATIGFSEAASSADTASAAAVVAFTETAASSDDFQVGLPPEPPYESGGGGDAWAGTGRRPYLGREPLDTSPPAPRVKEAKPRVRPRAERFVPPRPRQTPVRLSAPALPGLPEPLQPALRYVSFSDNASADDSFDVMATTTERPPVVPYRDQIEELELLLLAF